MKRFVIEAEIEEGKTECKGCPFGVRVWDNHWGEYEYECGASDFTPDCTKYNLQTINIIKKEIKNEDGTEAL